MTDKTDIPAMGKLIKQLSKAKADCQKSFYLTPAQVEIVIGIAEQLEAERQRADYRQQVIDQRNAECDRLIAELAALRGKQEPVAWTDAEELRDVEKHGCGYLFKIDPANPYTDPRRQIMVYRRQPKPVVVLPKLTVGEVMHRSGFDRQYAEGWVSANDWAINELKADGNVVKDGE